MQCSSLQMDQVTISWFTAFAIIVVTKNVFIMNVQYMFYLHAYFTPGICNIFYTSAAFYEDFYIPIL